MDWPFAAGDWPNRRHSRLVECRPHLWHVQEAGSGPTLLLLHGTGAATQSWRDLFPLLAAHYHVVAPDLPGQGFTRMGTRQRSGIDTMAEDLARLCRHRGWTPAALVGHSAGAALALRLSEIMDPAPRAIVGLNAALGTFKGVAGWLYPMLARGMAAAPLTPTLLARLSGGVAQVRTLLASTGSRIDEDGVRCYARLLRDPKHLEGTLAMIAQWRIEGLLARLPEIESAVCLMVGEDDRTVPPATSAEAAARMPHAEVRRLPGLGHLAHEEAPALVAGEIRSFLDRHL